MADTSSDTPGRFAYEGLDRDLHEKARLGILTALATRPAGLLFPELASLCSLTDGNLNRHLHVLAQAGLVAVEKQGQGRRSRTTVRMTPLGRQRFRDYLAHLEQILRDAAVVEPTGDVGLAPT